MFWSVFMENIVGNEIVRFDENSAVVLNATITTRYVGMRLYVQYVCVLASMCVCARTRVRVCACAYVRS